MYTLIFKAVVLMILGSPIGFRITAKPVDKSVRGTLMPFVKVYDFQKIDQAIEQVRAQKEFPLIGEFKADAQDGTIPKNIVNRFAKMNREIFGRDDIVRLVPADGNFAAAHEAGRVVGFPRDALSDLEKNATMLDFSLAHTLSHYIYELYIERLSQNKKSPHENESRKGQVATSETPAAAAAHAEIDAIALAIMMKMGTTQEELHNAMVARFSSDKKLVDRLSSMTINELTMFSAIPEDFRAKVRDNYIRFLSYLSSYRKRG